MGIQVIEGDITALAADAMICAVGAGGRWQGGVASAVRAAVGGRFDGQAHLLDGRPEGSTQLAESAPADGAPPLFQRLLFVLDLQEMSLHKLVLGALLAADQAGLTSVTVPALRLGLLVGAGEEVESKVRELARAAHSALSQAQHLVEITFVFYGDAQNARRLREQLALNEALKIDVSVEVAAFSGEGRQLATADYDGLITVWDTQTGQRLREVPPNSWHDSWRVDALALDHQGQQMLVGKRFAPTCLYRDGQYRFSFKPPSRQGGWQRTKAVAFSSNGGLAAAGFGRWIGVWRTDNGELVHALDLPFPPDRDSGGYSETPVNLFFFEGDKKLFAGCGDETFCTFDLVTDQSVPSQPLSEVMLAGIVDDQNGLRWATSDGRLWPGGLLFAEQGWSSVCFSSDGLELAAVLENGRTVRFNARGDVLAEAEGVPLSYHPKLGLLTLCDPVGDRIYRSLAFAEGRLRFSSAVAASDIDVTPHYLRAGRQLFSWKRGSAVLNVADHACLSGHDLFEARAGVITRRDLRDGTVVTVPFDGPQPTLRANAECGRLVGETNDTVLCWDRDLNFLWGATREKNFSAWELLSDGSVVSRRSTVAWPSYIFEVRSSDGLTTHHWGYTSYDFYKGRLPGDVGTFLIHDRTVELRYLRTGKLRQSLSWGRGPRSRKVASDSSPAHTASLSPEGYHLAPVVHGGRRLYHWVQSCPSSDLVLVQVEEGVAIMDQRGRYLDSLEFEGLPVVAHLRPGRVTLFTQAGQIFRWLRSADGKG